MGAENLEIQATKIDTEKDVIEVSSVDDMIQKFKEHDVYKIIQDKLEGLDGTEKKKKAEEIVRDMFDRTYKTGSDGFSKTYYSVGDILKTYITASVDGDKTEHITFDTTKIDETKFFQFFLEDLKMASKFQVKVQEVKKQEQKNDDEEVAEDDEQSSFYPFIQAWKTGGFLGILDFIAQKGKKIGPMIKAAIGDATDTVVGLAEVFGTNVSGWFEKGGNKASKVAKKAVKKAKETTFVTNVTEVVEDIGDNISEFKEKLLGKIDNLKIMFKQNTSEKTLPLMSTKALNLLAVIGKKFPGVRITSTLRTEKENEDLAKNSERDSQHLYGHGFDIGRDLNKTPEENETYFQNIKKYIEKADPNAFVLIHGEGDERHIHVDTRELKKGEVYADQDAIDEALTKLA